MMSDMNLHSEKNTANANFIATVADAIEMQMYQDLSTNTAENPLQRASNAHQIVKHAFDKLNITANNYKFGSPEEEILYFKKIKPKIWHELIYYTELFLLEQNKPLTGNDTIEAHFSDFLNVYRQYFYRHKTFHTYYRLDHIHMDASYFTKDGDKSNLPPEDIIDSEKESHLEHIYSYRLAKFQALERLIDQIKFEIQCLHQPNLENTKNSGLRWTESNVALIELAYAIQSTGAVNNGKVDIKTIIIGLQNLFQIDLGNYYGVYNQNIRIRKKERAAFIQQLKAALEKRMDNSDEDPRFK